MSRLVARDSLASMPTLGQRIRALRESRGMTQKDLADAAGILSANVSQYERDVRRNPKLDLILDLCTALEVTPGELLDGIDHPRDVSG